MDVSASECSSSGCQSGWTMYLDQSSLSKTQYQGFGEFVGTDDVSLQEEGEEDLSMVSDASSGPPHFREDEEENCFNQFDKKSKVRNKSKEYGRKQQSSHLDDTASSASLVKKMVRNEAPIDGAGECSQGFSETHFKGKSTLKKQPGLFKSSIPEKSASEKPGGFQGRI